ncbi:VG15 protein [Streptomyces pseudogriseolus]|uniref:VG15 protein n=1 Tax=Streptomyces pseudogriseolus TaxID=36817 RepID=UPI003FA33DC5
MATTVSDNGDDAARFRAAQIGLTRLLVRDVRGLRRLILPSRLRESVPDWLAAMNLVVAQYSRTSAALAAEFYDAQREAAGVPGPFTVPLADPPPEEQTTASLRWATKDLWPREPEVATPAQLEPLDVRLVQAEKKAEQVAQKLVADTGRGTVQAAVRQDRQATAWARSAARGACAFCKMLALRGAVFAQDTADFRAHDGCHCGVIPVFRGQRFELSPHAREWERLYREYAQGHSGDQLRRFRLALAEHDSNPLPGSN